MNKGRSQEPTETDKVPVEAEDMATHQETIPVPYLGGTRGVAVRFITEALDMVTVLAPDARPAKK